MPIPYNNLYRVLIVMAGLSSLLKTNGQNTSGKIDKETLMLIEQTPDEIGKETGALIILKDYQMTVNEKGQTKLTIRILGKVYDKTAMSDYSQIPIRFNSYYDEPALIYARVIHSDGTVREVPEDAVQIKTTPDYEGLQYNDSRYLSFALSGMEVGACFDYKVTFTEKNQAIEGEWYYNHWFGGMLQKLSPPYLPRIDPVIKSSFSILVPKGSQFQYHLYSAKAEPNKRSSGGLDEYKWVLTNIPAISVEDGMPPLSKQNAVLILSSIDNWEIIDQWAARKILSKVETTGEVSSKAKEVTAGKVSKDEKILAIKDFIQANIQYIYADIDRGGYAPHSASEILRSRYGDCKDQTVLLISMLKVVGIEAYPALINPFPYDEFTEIPIPQFAHLITFIPMNNREIWLDMTTSSTPYPDLFLSNQDRKAFIINGKGGRLTNTPSSGPNENITNFIMKASYLDNVGVVNMKLEAKGAQSDMLKQLFKELDKKSLDESLDAMARINNEKALIDSSRISDLHNPETHFSLSLEYHLDSIWIKGQGGITFSSHAFFPLSVVTNIDPKSIPEKRHNDIIGPYMYTVKGIESYSKPVKDLLHVSFPKSDSLNSEIFNFYQTFSSSADKFNVEWTLICKEKTIKKEKYDDYKNTLTGLTEMLKWTIDYVDPDLYISSVAKAETPAKMMSYSNQLLKDEPGNILALLLKGMAYTKSGQFEQAYSVYQDIIKKWPENKYAYVHIIYPLIKRNNTAGAIESLNKAIKIDPEYEFAYVTRGGVYADQGSNEKALADYNTALKINPEDISCLRWKFQLLNKMGRELESIACLEEMTRIDSTNLMLCAALGQVYLEKKLYKKAISVYHKAVQIDHNNAENWGNLGWAYYMADDDKKCIEYSIKALEINQSTYFAKYNLGLAYLRSGNFSEARRIYSEMKDLKETIPATAYNGAMNDLNDLKAKGKYSKEIKDIQKEFF